MAGPQPEAGPINAACWKISRHVARMANEGADPGPSIHVALYIGCIHAKTRKRGPRAALICL